MELKATSFEDIILKLGKPENKFFFIFRGQSNADWKLIPKVARKPYSDYFINAERETIILESWKRYSIQYIDKMPDDDWDWLTLAQHYNLATRLLDWSKNPLTGLFFAVYQNQDIDAALYALRQPKIIARGESNPFNVKSLKCLYPKGISARVVNQRGVFTVTPDPSVPIEDLVKSDDLFKIIIPKRIIGDIRKNLDFYGVNEFSLYPELTGLSNYLNNTAIEMI